ncbi:hypothetical protein PMG71_11230 [Roseofilum sp. BLCC_M154]|uniref:Uncharacterized protein n=1 Tax=Roseofilum acuticapitatum BLCC-M154 TaxID=3022444 RepID=A0ABT7AU97_9CYAN|nr:hypothetical protein [Roseofilum acuticapitatum]MDJ1169999.1 hypothetical protein [Roseofilum acuticapitatum BLCC-M154]
MQPSNPLERDRESAPAVSTQGVSTLLSLTTLPVVLGLLALKNMGQFWQQVGQDSEEVFRGDRLPLLTTAHPDSANILSASLRQ